MSGTTPDKVNAVDRWLGQRLKASREAQELSLSQAARRVRVTYQTLKTYEAGTNRVAFSRLIDLAIAYRVPPTHFVTGIPIEVLEQSPAQNAIRKGGNA